jgi:basic amino acid/polyamine antiporter, APA family
MAASRNELKKVLGTGFGIAVMIGGTIGVGILRTPGTIATHLPNYWLIIACWIIGGTYVLLGAGPFAEMACMMPKAGGPYNYVKRAFGEYAGFLAGWFDYIVNAIGPAYFCIVISEYTVLLFPALKSAELYIAIGFLLAFVALHSGGIKNGSIAQQITSVIKVVFFTALIISCFVVDVEPSQEQVASVLEGGLLIGFLRSMQLVTGAYDGWWAVCFFAEEQKEPAKSIPRSLFTGAIMVTLIYVILNLAIFQVLPVSAISNSSLVASDAARVVFGDAGSTFVTVLAVVSLISILNAYMMIPARILFGLSRDGFFIPQGTKVNKGGTPVIALLISSAISLTLIITSSFEQLFGLASFMVVVVMGLAFAAHIQLRRAEPDAPRPYKAWGYPYTTIIVVLVSIGLFIGFAIGDRQNLILILIVAALSYPAYKIITNKKIKAR